MSRVILPFKTSPLAFPGRPPAFDPSQFASLNVRFAGVASGKNFVNLLNDKKGTAAAGVSSKIYSGIGPAATSVNTAGTNAGITFASGGRAGPASMVMAFIYQYQASGQFQGLFNADPAGFNTWMFGIVSFGGYQVYNGTAQNSNIGSPANDAPIFVVVSANATTINIVERRLDTGAIRTDTFASSAVSGNEGTYTVGDTGFGGGNAFNGGYSTALYGAPNQILPIPQMLQLAQDPWALWYARTLDLTSMLSVAAGGGNVFNVSATEAATATEAESVVAVFAASDSETGIAVDSPSVTAVFVASDTEAGTATDTPTAGTSTPAAITESATAVDAETVTAVFAPSITEAGTATDTDVSTATFVSSQAEAGAATDSPSASAVFAVSDAEAANATDAEVTSIDASVTEAATATEAETATVVFAAAATESGTAADTSTVAGIFAAAASEAGSATDAETAAAVFAARDTEAATASDASNGVIPGPPPPIGNVHYLPFFATPGSLTSLP